jgi:hypothetical protein
MPQADSVHAQGKLLLPVTLSRLDVRIIGTSGPTVASVGSCGRHYDKPVSIWIDCINLPASFLLPYSSLSVPVHMIEGGGREEDISPMAGEKEESIVHGNARSISNPSCDAAVAAQSRNAKSDRWPFR